MAKRTSHPDQLSLDFDAPIAEVVEASLEPQVSISSTPIGDALIAEGFVPNKFLLDLNRAIDCGEGPAPSRAYRWPFHYMPPSQLMNEGERLLCSGRDLVVTETAKRVLERFADEIEFVTDGIADLRRHHHAIDLMSEEHVDHLLATRHLTKREFVAGAVALNLWSSNRPISVETARRVLVEIGVPEPEDRSVSALTSPAYPHLTTTSSEGPTVNLPHGEIGGWCAVHGIEDGWLIQRKRRFLAPSQKLLDARNPSTPPEAKEPITIVPDLTPRVLAFGMPVNLDWDGPASITVSTPETGVLGHVLGHLVQPLTRMLSAVDVQIEASLGQIDDRAFEVIIVRTTDDGTFRNVVRCARPDFEYRQAA